jgi:UDP-N-acetylmuramyl pentapeptide synthase
LFVVILSVLVVFILILWFYNVLFWFYGIANWLEVNMKGKYDFLICEVDGYNKHEYELSGTILKPDFTLLTNIGDQHLQRFGSLNNLAIAMGCFLNLSNSNYINEKDRKLLENAKVFFNNFCLLKEYPHKFSESYLKSNFDLAINFSKDLDIKEEYINYCINNFKREDRRGNLTDLYGFEMLDASYNISFNTAITLLKEANELAQQKGKDLLVVTGGIPELSEENKENNKNFGSEIIKNTDKVVVFNTIFCREVLRGIKNKNEVFVAKDFDSFKQYLLGNFDKNKVLILLFPELTDIYY